MVQPVEDWFRYPNSNNTPNTGVTQPERRMIMLHANIRLKTPVATIAASITAFTLTLTGIPAAVASTASANTISDTIKTLKASNITVLGGQGALSDEVVSALTGVSRGRISGNNRYETAVFIAKQAYPNGVKKVYLARGDQPADALAASNLKDGALLLAPPNLGNPSVTATVSNAIKELGADSVTVLGGQGALSDQVVNALTSLPVSRIAGMDRYGTAVQIVQNTFQSRFNPQGRVVKKVYVARGDNPADALAASNLKDGALLLAPPLLSGENDRINAKVVGATAFSIGAASISILGGGGAVSDEVMNGLFANISSSLPMNRIYGVNRYDTAALIAKQPWPNGTSKIYLARGDQPADALAASNLKDGALLLAPPATKQVTQINQQNAPGQTQACVLQSSDLKTVDNLIKREFNSIVNEARREQGASALSLNSDAEKAATWWAGESPDRHSTATERNQAGFKSPIQGENMILGYQVELDRSCGVESVSKEIANEMFQIWWNSPGHRKIMLNSQYNAFGLGFISVLESTSSNKRILMPKVVLILGIDETSEAGWDAYCARTKNMGYAQCQEWFERDPEIIAARKRTCERYRDAGNELPNHVLGGDPAVICPKVGVAYPWPLKKSHREAQLEEHQRKTCEVHQRSRRPISVKVLGGDPELVCAKFGIKYDWVSDISGVSSGSVGLRDDLPRQGGESSWVYCNPEIVVNCPPGVSTVKPE
ncbi:cell wall-binding repeat-containing protein [Mobiluncus mulieris]|uniref:SCP domain-containing protein n=2 Tax=Mobiluncus mulieris TaxID=2052 RepID=A0A7Y0UU68_9ACTO|nr:cell wall-binding repeat-containing protein [Mobiluncus mulieris]MCV0002961.1 hypothetical protein [Mobiluncus mulieris]NMX03812.1 hypothetical protein [Mobiluncus mulieris]NMX11698.1 hypothetical protein [Mobiluncus mulieris]